jgi:hypothetical protein
MKTLKIKKSKSEKEPPTLNEIYPDGWYSCQFEPSVGHSTVVAALFPPAKSVASEQHSNATSRKITAGLGHSRYNWVDLSTKAPTGLNSRVKQKKLREWALSSVSVQSSWGARVLDTVVDSGVVYVAGETCGTAWGRLVDRGELGAVKSVSATFNVQRHTLADGKTFYAHQAPHPTAHMLSRKPCAVAAFLRTMHVLNVIATDHDWTPESLLDSMTKAQRLREARKAKVLEALGAEEQDLNSVFKTLPLQHQHVADNFELFVKEFGPMKSKSKLKLLNKFVGKMATLDWVERVVGVQKRLSMSVEQLTTFMCDGVASALNGPNRDGFMESLLALTQPPFDMSVEQLTTFGGGSVASALNGPNRDGFMESLLALTQPPFHMSVKQLTTFMGNSVASALNGPNRDGFMEPLLAFMQPPFDMSVKQLTTFGGDSVASALNGPNRDGFMESLLPLMQPPFHMNSLETLVTRTNSS